MTRLRAIAPLLVAAALAAVAVATVQHAGCDEPGRYELADDGYELVGGCIAARRHRGAGPVAPRARGHRPDGAREELRPHPASRPPADQAVQRVPQVLEQVLDVLDADRQADQVVRHLQRGTGHRRVRHRGRVLDQRLHATERLGQGEQLGGRADAQRRLAPARHPERHHARRSGASAWPRPRGRGARAARGRAPARRRGGRRASRRCARRCRSAAPCARRGS